MIVYVNGRFVPEQGANISVFDRCFLYGDGVFETILVYNYNLFRWDEHFNRLSAGANFLGISLPIKSDELKKDAVELAIKNNMPKGMLRITLSRGVGLRGYSPRGAREPVIVMSIHPMPAVSFDSPNQWSLVVSVYNVPANNPIYNHKTCSKLTNVLAKTEADKKGADEAIILNTDGDVASASAANIFVLTGGVALTPFENSGALKGITRAVVFELCKKLGIHYGESRITLKDIQNADGVFLTLSSWGIVEATTVDGKPLNKSELTQELYKAYWNTVEQECTPASETSSSELSNSNNPQDSSSNNA